VDVLGPFESFEIQHRAQDRRLFALGALKLAQRLAMAPARAEAYSPAELWKLGDHK